MVSAARTAVAHEENIAGTNSKEKHAPLRLTASKEETHEEVEEAHDEALRQQPTTL